MPARPALAPRARPRGLARLACLPQREVHRRLLALVDLDPGAGLQIFDLFARELAVAGEALDGEVNVALHAVGDALFLEAADEFYDLRHVLRSLGLFRRRQQPERPAVGLKLVDIAPGHRFRRGAFRLRPPDDLVVHVGEVADEMHAVTEEYEIAIDGVEGEQRARVADVGRVVDGHAADVDARLPCFQGGKRLFFSGKSVVNLQPHWVFSSLSYGLGAELQANNSTMF